MPWTSYWFWERCVRKYQVLFLAVLYYVLIFPERWTRWHICWQPNTLDKFRWTWPLFHFCIQLLEKIIDYALSLFWPTIKETRILGFLIFCFLGINSIPDRTNGINTVVDAFLFSDEHKILQCRFIMTIMYTLFVNLCR